MYRKGSSLTMRMVVFAIVALFPLTALAAGDSGSKPWYTGIMPIILLLAAVIIVISRLKQPKGLAHLENKAFRYRRALNWISLGMTYAFLYWGRYNLQPALQAIGEKIGSTSMIADFGWVFGVGTAVYGVSFIINGPLTDRKGGRFSILCGAIGAAAMNLLIGIACWMILNSRLSANGLFWSLIVLYPINMYFQSFGAVAIVKCNAAWFHVNERGVFSAIFGIMISMGIYFAFDWSYAITKFAPPNWAFWAPALALGIMFVVDLLVVRNRPSEANYPDIPTGDASEGDDSPLRGAREMFKLMFKNKTIISIACIEFCSGFLRQAIMQMYRFFAKSTDATLHLKSGFVYENWGMCLCIAGILGGVFAGTISDRVFQSRRGPVAAVLYAGMFVGAVGMFFLLGSPAMGWLMIFMSMCIIGVHGMLSGTASMDFGGSKNVGVAVGLIDGFVYAGTAAQALLYAFILPKGKSAAAAIVSNWRMWPVAMVPLTIIGLVISYSIRNEKPKPKNG